MAKQAKKGAGRPKTRTHAPERAAGKQTKEGEEKYIIIASTEDIETMKALAYWNRLTIKETYAEAIADYKAKYEKKNGQLKQRPA
jgi:hypothetical protein